MKPGKVGLTLVLVTLVATPVITTEEKDPILSYRTVESPFRMRKINLVWEKARKSLEEGKLRILYSDLKVQDKEELTLKKLKAESGDKAGLRETEVRKLFNGILNKYGLIGVDSQPRRGDDLDELSNKGQPKHFFKDKKLNRLWEKAEKSGLTEEELIALKQEFRHHQDKVEQYNQLLEMSRSLGEAGEVLGNHIHLNDDDDEGDGGQHHGRHDNELKGLKEDVKDGYDRLHRLATNAKHQEFQEPKVEALWKLAQDADFSDQELESLRSELHHYDTRLQKLHFLREELRMVDERQVDKEEVGDANKTEGRRIMDKKLQKHVEAAEKMERHLERTIAARHSEL